MGENQSKCENNLGYYIMFGIVSLHWKSGRKCTCTTRHRYLKWSRQWCNDNKWSTNFPKCYRTIFDAPRETNEMKWPVVALTTTWVITVQEQSFSIGSFNTSFENFKNLNLVPRLVNNIHFLWKWIVQLWCLFMASYVDCVTSWL